MPGEAPHAEAHKPAGAVGEWEGGEGEPELVVAQLKDPVRIYEKAQDDYAGDFKDGVVPEACVVDVLRAA